MRRCCFLDRLMSWHNPLVTQAPDFSVKPTITGDKVVLRPFAEDDFPGMLEVLRDPETLKLTGTVHDDAELASLAEEKSFHDWYASRNDQPDRLDLAVIDGARGGCVGEAVLNEWDPGNHSCSFRIALGPAGRGRGLGTEATRLIVGYGFERLGMHRISLEVYSFNPRARRVYERAGFRAEGVLRESLRYGGQWIDATVMSILACEWAEHHGHPSQGTGLRPGGAGPLRRDVRARCRPARVQAIERLDEQPGHWVLAVPRAGWLVMRVRFPSPAPRSSSSSLVFKYLFDEMPYCAVYWSVVASIPVFPCSGDVTSPTYAGLKGGVEPRRSTKPWGLTMAYAERRERQKGVCYRGYAPCWAGSGCWAGSAGVVGCRVR
jgi:RimJ/RimL family protein N-acetyltransferase